MLITKKDKRNLQDLSDLKNLRSQEQNKNLRLQQMKEATNRLISNETSQYRSIGLKDDANRSAVKISKRRESNERE
jgi:hypothetical protein